MAAHRAISSLSNTDWGDRAGRMVGPVAAGFAYFTAATLSLALTQGADGIATMWPPSGLLLAILLLVPRTRIPIYLLTAGAASICANLSAGNPLFAAIGFTLANLVEAVVAAWMLRRRGGRRVSFVDPAGIAHFGKAALIGALASAALATAAQEAVTGAAPNVAFAYFFLSWFSTVLIGMLLVGPMILLAMEVWRAPAKALATTRPAEAIMMIVLVAVIAGATFGQSALPVLFLPMMAVVAAVFRLGTIGAAASVLTIAAVSSAALALGHGPPTLVPGGREMQVLFLQFYLLALFASALPTAALLAGRDRLQVELAEKLRLLTLAERAAQIGHWRVDAAQRQIFWSTEVFRIHGLPIGDPPAYEDAIDAYHPDDQARIGSIVEQALIDGQPFEFTARLIRPDGSICRVVSRGERDYSSDDKAIGLFGLIQDVTAQMEVERVLTEAREAAELAARTATVMAETDQLTGLVNRRKTLDMLERAIDTARRDGTMLAVAIFDIDHFKGINDTYGHAIGDRVLCRVARAAEGALRVTDVVGRLGGEEFVLILPFATADIAMNVAERVRTAIQAGGGTAAEPRVTTSIGIAPLTAGDSPDELLHRADTALYAAKHEGRNQSRLAA